MSHNPYAPPTATVEDVSPRPGEASPPLWNPSAAAKWSLLFSPIFGAALQMKNWQALGEPEKAAQSKQWLIGSIGLFALLFVLGIVLPESRGTDLAFRGAGIGLLVAWYTLSAKLQVAHVAARFGTTYPRKGWGKPILYAVLIFFAFLVAVFVVAFVISLLVGES
jgi:hypothetical protein